MAKQSSGKFSRAFKGMAPKLVKIFWRYFRKNNFGPTDFWPLLGVKMPHFWGFLGSLRGGGLTCQIDGTGQSVVVAQGRILSLFSRLKLFYCVYFYTMSKNCVHVIFLVACNKFSGFTILSYNFFSRNSRTYIKATLRNWSLKLIFCLLYSSCCHYINCIYKTHESVY